MAFEIIRGEDLRIVMSHLAQTNYTTALSPANLNAGKSFRPAAAGLPEITRQLVREGPVAFTGHEFPLAANEKEVRRDLAFPLNFDPVNSWLIAWAAAFALGSVTSVQEGTTGRYTHTIRPSDPLGGAGTFVPKVTSIYFDSGGPDTNRRKAILPSLAIVRFALTGRLGVGLALALDFLGSGKEDTATVVTPPALSSEVLFTGQQFKLELGDKGGSLADITERIREWTFTCEMQVDAEHGYVPNAASPAEGRFRSTLRFLRRTFALEFAAFADRASTDLRSRVFNETVSEIKITADSGVAAGTSTTNHRFVIRIPACRLAEAPYEFDDAGAFYRVAVPPTKIFKDAAIADSPVTITVDNDQASYLV